MSTCLPAPHRRQAARTLQRCAGFLFSEDGVPPRRMAGYPAAFNPCRPAPVFPFSASRLRRPARAPDTGALASIAIPARWRGRPA
ncbi:hypothetical protein CBM2586_A10055 [Cupriavidus phytorum]|uniref:Uncharacterized protein n=1 Tax=Cupriavidus taiwanensis TaxID=164546 RepID=A0A375B912_9BURK|nr:hypothetical protein CBM2586_A10055 [Cupriavidus taiwanensis]